MELGGEEVAEVGKWGVRAMNDSCFIRKIGKYVIFNEALGNLFCQAYV